MNGEGILAHLLKQVGITPNSFPSNERQGWSSGLYDAEGEVIPKNKLFSKELVYDKKGNPAGTSPDFTRGLLSLMPTSPFDLALETGFEAVSTGTGNPLFGIAAGFGGGTAMRSINKFNPKTKKIESVYFKNQYDYEQYANNKSIKFKFSDKPLGIDPNTPSFRDLNPQGKSSLPLTPQRKEKTLDHEQHIWMPETGKIEVVSSDEFQHIVKNYDKRVPDAPYLQHPGTKDSRSVDNFEPFGGLGWKSSKEPYQYAQINTSMSDIDFPDGQHWSKDQITADNLGDALEIMKKYTKDNPNSALDFGLTPGGARVLDASKEGARANMDDALKVDYKKKFLYDTKSDPFYSRYELNRIKLDGTDQPGTGPITSAVRLDQKLDRYRYLLGDRDIKPVTTGEKGTGKYLNKNVETLTPPFSYQNLGLMGKLENIDGRSFEAINQHHDMINDLRGIRGIQDPNNREFGIGFLNQLEKQLKTVSPKDRNSILKKLKL